MLLKKRKTKFLMTRFLKLRGNIQNRPKLLKLKKKKWHKSIEFYKKSLKWYNKFKPYDQTQYVISRHPNKGTAYNKRYRNSLNAVRRLRSLYGDLSKKEFKSILQKLFFKKCEKKLHTHIKLLKIFEGRLDSILVRAKFSKSFRNARQLISHKKVMVNNLIVSKPSYLLKPGDLIKINVDCHTVIERNFKFYVFNSIINNTTLWPIPPKNLIVNFKSMEIFFCGNTSTNFSTDFLFHLNLEKVLL